MEENNKLIAEFMGKKFKAYKNNSSFNKEFNSYAECAKWISEERCPGYKPEIGWELGCGLYHNSWDWLMPVADKIRLMGPKVTIEADYYVSHSTNRAEIMNFRTFPEKPKIVVFYRGDEGTLLKATYGAVVEFINRYNEKQLENGRDTNS